MTINWLRSVSRCESFNKRDRKTVSIKDEKSEKVEEHSDLSLQKKSLQKQRNG